MTNEDLFNDLKQFIEAKLAQQLTDVATKDDLAGMATKADLAEMATRADMAAFEQRLDEKLDEIQNAIGEHVGHTDDTLGNHERRLTQLEQQSA